MSRWVKQLDRATRAFWRARGQPACLLTSGAGDFGGNGAYVVVKGANGHHAARVPIHETFHVYVDDEGVLRTDHVLRLWSPTVLRLHYKLCPF